MSKITVDREVLERALAALKKCDSALSEELAAWDIDPPLHHVLEASNACGPAIEALNAELAQPQQEPFTDLQIGELLYKYGYDADDEAMRAMIREAVVIANGGNS